MKASLSAKRISPTPPAAQSVTAKRRAKTTSQGKKYAAIRRDLERQRKAMLEEVVEGLANPNGQEAFPDVSDQASAEAEQNFSMRIREREQRLIKKIDEALERMDQNTYGICERCEEEIPYPRLKARPVTTLCINCKTLQEQEEKVGGEIFRTRHFRRAISLPECGRVFSSIDACGRCGPDATGFIGDTFDQREIGFVLREGPFRIRGVVGLSQVVAGNGIVGAKRDGFFK